MRGDSPPRFFVITDRQATNGRPLIEAVNAVLCAIESCARARGRSLEVGVQMRDKDLPGAQRLHLGRGLRDISRDHGARFYVNDGVDLALALGADGVQLGRASLPVRVVRQIAPKLEVGFSAHCVEEITRIGRECDFFFLGPVFLTPAKDGLIPVIDLHSTTKKIKNDMPVIAIGGINESNLHELDWTFFYGAACIRSGLNESSATAVVKKLLNMFP